MKRDTIMTIVLGFTIIISLLLSYFVLFDSQPVRDVLVGVTTSTSQSDATVETKASPLYEKADLTIREVFYPEKLIVKQGKQTYDVNNAAILQRVEQQLNDSRIELSRVNVVANVNQYNRLFEANRVELIFTRILPITMLDHIMNIGVEGGTTFEMDRILWLNEAPEDIYIVNSRDQTFIKLQGMPALARDIFELVKDVEKKGIPVEAEVLKESVAYLPIASFQKETERYILESIPDTQFVKDVFPTSNFNILETGTEEIKKFNNYQVTLTLNTQSQMMDLEIAVPDQKVPSTPELKIRTSFKELRQYEYWNEGMRYDGIKDSAVSYRHYLKGLPIVTQKGGIDYAVTTVNLRPITKINGNIFQMPTLILYAHLSNRNEAMTLESAEEVKAVIDQSEHELNEFSRIFVAYEWQLEMEQFQVVKLIPKWYVEINNQLYSLAEVADGTMNDSLNTAHGYER